MRAQSCSSRSARAPLIFCAVWRGHGLVSETLYDAIISNCTWANEDAACNNLLNEAANAIGDIDIYYLCVFFLLVES